MLGRARISDANGGGLKKTVKSSTLHEKTAPAGNPTLSPQRQHQSRFPNGQGDDAPTPDEMPRGGWPSFYKRVYASLKTKHLSMLAGGVAFYGMLSIFPALAALVALYGLVADPATIQHQISAIHGLIPDEAQKVIETYLNYIVTSSSSKLGLDLIVSLAVALRSAGAGTVSLIWASAKAS